jgi:hypothetical protein
MRASARTAAAVVAAGISLACVGCGHPAARPGTATCWQSAVRAIERHVTVRSVPRACAKLSAAQLAHVVASAVREAAGPHPKAVERRIAAADARYLASLVRGSPAPARLPPAALARGGAPGARPASQDGLGLAALACWAVTAAAGGYLFSGYRRPGAHPRRPPAIAAGHAGVALAGLALWAVVTAVPASAALTWAATAVVIGAAGLGMAVLLTVAPEPAALEPSAAAPRGGQSGPVPRRVLAIACHVALAVVTMLLVLLTATGRS